MIYVIQQGKEGPIKIGYTRDANVNRRIRQLQNSNPYPLHLLSKFNGSVKLEKELHKKLEIYKIRGEWFKPEVINSLDLQLYTNKELVGIGYFDLSLTTNREKRDGLANRLQVLCTRDSDRKT